MSTESVMPSSHLILCCPFSCPQSFPASVFSNELTLSIKWSKYWCFSFRISPSNSGLISFRMDLFELLAVQKALKNLLQHLNSKASVFWHSAFFMHQLSHLYRTTVKKNSFDCTEICWQSEVSAFQYAI